MIATPWGDSADLRSSRLPPGPASSPREVAANQRRRLLGAMVAGVAEKGYEATGVADLSEISGVSPRSFYQLFASKQECFLATLEEVIALFVGRTLEAVPAPTWQEEARARVVAFASAVAEQPASARLFLVEAYAAGREPAALVDAAIGNLERQTRERLIEVGFPETMPQEMTVAAVAAVVGGVRNRLLQGQVGRLPEYAGELASFLLDFEPPGRPLRVAVRAPERRDEEREAGDHAERALRAFEAVLVERSFGEVTMGQVAERAGMSVKTLYANFSDREELMLAAVDAAAMQAVAVMLPAYRRKESPSEGVRAAFSALFGMLASRPKLAHLLLLGVREGGAKALGRRLEVLRQIEPLLSAGVPPHQRPVSIRVASEALLSAVLELAGRRLSESGAGALPGLVPICSFMLLAPILGAEQATAAAAGKGYRKLPAATSEAVLRAGRRPISQQILVAFIAGPKSAAEVTEQTLLSRREVDEQIEILETNGVLRTSSPPSGSESVEAQYEITWARMDSEESRRRSKPEREAMSIEVGQVIRAELEEAVAAGTFDARPDRSLVRLPLWLDEQGWRELSLHLDDSLDGGLEIQRRAGERLLAGGDPEAGSYGRLLLASFEVP